MTSTHPTSYLYPGSTLTMIERKKIIAMRADGSRLDCELLISKRPPWTIELQGLSDKPLIYSGPHLFAALFEMRKELEKDNIILLVNGARKNAHAGGMCTSMGNGRKVYMVELFLPGLRDSIVDIFDFAELEVIVSTSEQAAFNEKWRDCWLSNCNGNEKPIPSEIEEAKQKPNSRVQRIAGRFFGEESVPPEAIVGSWQVDAEGNIIGKFIPNPSYNPKLVTLIPRKK